MTHANRSRLTFDPGGDWRAHWGAQPLPHGAQALGTVTRGADIGALVLTAGQQLAIGNAGELQLLDQRKAKIAIARELHRDTIDTVLRAKIIEPLLAELDDAKE